MINIAQETLDLRCAYFSYALSLLMPTFSFLLTPTFVAEHLHPEGSALTAVVNRMLPYHDVIDIIHNFGAMFSPEYYRR